jgi:GntR family transcriptional regulator
MVLSNVVFMIDPAGPVPIYRQLAAILEKQIEDGTLPADRPVPSETTLRQTYGVSRGTARRAVEVLREEGLVVTVPGKGSYVKPKP